MKQTVSVSIESSLMKAARQAGINVSQVCEQAIYKSLEGKSPTSIELEIANIDATLRHIKKQRQIHSEALRQLEQREADLRKRRQELQEQLKQERASYEFARVMRSINEIVKQCGYNEKLAWNSIKEQRKQLKELDYSIDFKWFKRHVQRLQILNQ